ncbi:hypothetical protein GCM10010393_60000 [Streptomyces gobitricini]|uniref:Uncharacterized protein n=1 Tax=Streptomyces gobitricini TaxID=68211 RepID=A0ABP6AN15_9ACTN
MTAAGWSPVPAVTEAARDPSGDAPVPEGTARSPARPSAAPSARPPAPPTVCVPLVARRHTTPKG